LYPCDPKRIPKGKSTDYNDISLEEGYKLLAIKLDGFVRALLESMYLARLKFYDQLFTKIIHFSPILINYYIMSLCGYFMLETFSKSIKTHIKSCLPGIR